ncbi:MAG TPA: Uma2 family endonuclease [Thermoanaerobaculia bacterium]|jgi:Uma2 family endonuclease|nr:Uma2 family endonuclease [Thermoanaerobaculia bacterium]
MAVALLKEPPLSPDSGLGPYRRADYEALPDEPRCELIFGRFYLSPSPSLLHQTVLILLLRCLDDIAMKTGGRLFVAPLDVHLMDHSVVQPDLLYVSAARREILRERIEGAPDLVVEILSPGTARRDRGQKLALYADSGVREYWIVDALERQIEFLVNENGRFVVAMPLGDEYRSGVLPEIHLDLSVLWKNVDERLSGH